MKTNRFFPLLALSIMISLTSLAQGYDYDYMWSYTMYGHDYSYECKSTGGRVRLYNSANRYGNDPAIAIPQSLKDGTVLDWDYVANEGDTFGSDQNEVLTRAKRIAVSALSSLQLQAIRDLPRPRDLRIRLFINPETGRVMEVEFYFWAKSGYGVLPLDVYRQIELDMQQYIRFSITEVGRRMNYCFIAFDFDTEAVPLPRSQW